MSNTIKTNLLWLLFLLLTLVVALPITWVGLSKVNFFYSILHDSIGIDQHIQQFAPRNRFDKTEFEKTSKNERVALFHQVVIAIHNDGKRLDSLHYLRLSDSKKVKLFTEAEVIHLKDVAVLLTKLKSVTLFLTAIWLYLIARILLRRRVKLPSLKRFSALTLILLLIIFCVLLLGPEQVYNQLHIWAFPENHQWFFYYEDSLMSTMMKAPDLFAYILIIWTALSLLVSVILLKTIQLIQSTMW